MEHPVPPVVNPWLALPGGSVSEVVSDGVSGFVCKNVDEMAQHARNLANGPSIAPQSLRDYTQKHFSVQRMVRDYLSLYRSLAGESGPRQKKVPAESAPEGAAA